RAKARRSGLNRQATCIPTVELIGGKERRNYLHPSQRNKVHYRASEPHQDCLPATAECRLYEALRPKSRTAGLVGRLIRRESCRLCAMSDDPITLSWHRPQVASESRDSLATSRFRNLQVQETRRHDGRRTSPEQGHCHKGCTDRRGGNEHALRG